MSRSVLPRRRRSATGRRRLSAGFGALWLAACLLPAGARLVGAEGGLPQRLVLDPAASQVGFVLGATLHSVKGSFRVDRGVIGFDPDAGAANGRVVVDARSADTGSDGRDRKMHRDVLESERFPEIVFLPARLAVARRTPDEADVEISGTVEIHGVREPLSIPATLRREGDRVRIQGRFSVPYVEWGMRDYSNFVLRVAPSVDVSLDLAGRLEISP
jgi:polyisoprenoid-binding protein YceI